VLTPSVRYGYPHGVFMFSNITTTAQSEAWVGCRSLAGVMGVRIPPGRGCMSLSVACWQVEVCAGTDRSLVHESAKCDQVQ
jgi:hypothetical protein